MKHVLFSDVKFDAEFLERYGTLQRLKTDFESLSKITDKWGYIRQIYLEAMPWIFEAGRRGRRSGTTPYFLDWAKYFSPIEEDAWICIRDKGIPLYPQFPLFNYFVDFANPLLRIGVELDGKDWHDTESDRKRDHLLAAYGWRIFRIPGSETRIPFKAQAELDDLGLSRDERMEETKHWLLYTCDGVLTAIDEVYFRNRPEAYEGWCIASLDKHRLAEFELLEPAADAEP